MEKKKGEADVNIWGPVAEEICNSITVNKWKNNERQTWKNQEVVLPTTKRWAPKIFGPENEGDKVKQVLFNYFIYRNIKAPLTKFN